MSSPASPAPLWKRCRLCGFRYESELETCPADGVALGPASAEARLGPYRLVERIGVGGMSAVYRALNERIGRTVAVKLLHQSLRSETVSVSRFFHEARAVNLIRHPNVVEVYDLHGEGEDLYMVLEFLKGADLRTRLGEASDGRLAPDVVAHILVQVCGALHAAHARKIVHRDLKPENIFLVERAGQPNFVKLLDFGVAKLERQEGALTQEGITLGTPRYMAPEQARARDVDARSDVYALGCIMFEMLTGRAVFESDSAAALMLMHVRDPAPSPREINPQVPQALAALVLRCLAKSPDARPQSALELAQALAAAVPARFGTEPWFANPGKWEEPSSIELMPAIELRPAGAGKAPTPVRRRRQLALGGLALLASGVVFAFARRRPRASTAPIAAAPPATVAVLVSSTPPAAQIYDEHGNQLGLTPHTLSLPRGASRQVRLAHAGYEPALQTIHAGGAAQVTVTLTPERRTSSGKADPRGRRAPQRRSSKAALRARTSTARTLDPF